MKNLKWNRLDKGSIDNIFLQLTKDITKAKLIRENDDIKFYVGTDSQRHKGKIVFVTAIVMYMEKHGGAVYYVKENEKPTDMHTRLWNETYKAVNIAQELNNFLKDFNLRVNEIHADLNDSPKHKSNKLVSSCIKYFL